MTGRCNLQKGEDCSVADEIADAAVKRTFERLGIDVDDKDEVRHFVANQQWLFRLRKISDKVGMVIILTIIGLVTGATAKLLWEGLKSKVGTV